MTVSRDGTGGRPAGVRSSKRARLLTLLLPLIAIAVSLSACTFEGPTMTIDYKSPENRDIWGL